MLIVLWLIYLIIFIITTVSASNDATEGRITEHSIVSFVALSGLLFVTNIARKRRKSNLE